SSRRRHTRSKRDWSSDVCSSDLDSGGACILSDLGLFRGDDVHDDAALQLVGKTALDARGTGGDGRVRRSGLGCLAHVVFPVSSWLGVLALSRLSPRVSLARFPQERVCLGRQHVPTRWCSRPLVSPV